MNTKALLIGTNHFDRNGEVKIHDALTRFAPDHILVEGSRQSHEVNLAAKEVALRVMSRYAVSDAIRELLTFERDSLLRDAAAVDTYGKERPEVSIDFFKDEVPPSVEAVVKEMTQATERVLDKLTRLPEHIQANLVKQQMDALRQGFQPVKDAWEALGNQPDEKHFGDRLRQGSGAAKLDDRDLRKWRVIERLRDEAPESRIATVTGAAHILRTTRGVSLFDHIEASRSFETTREMVCFK